MSDTEKEYETVMFDETEAIVTVSEVVKDPGVRVKDR
jgi:hypothetical protein